MNRKISISLASLVLIAMILMNAKQTSARWYDPERGRFISRDPYGMIDGANPYTFAHNNPVNFVDPSGGCSEAAGAYNAEKCMKSLRRASKIYGPACDKEEDCMDAQHPDNPLDGMFDFIEKYKGGNSSDSYTYARLRCVYEKAKEKGDRNFWKDVFVNCGHGSMPPFGF